MWVVGSAPYVRVKMAILDKNESTPRHGKSRLPRSASANYHLPPPLSRSKSCFCWTDARGDNVEGAGIRPSPLSRSKSCFSWTDARGDDVEGAGTRPPPFNVELVEILLLPDGRSWRRCGRCRNTTTAVFSRSSNFESHLASSVQNLVQVSSSSSTRGCNSPTDAARPPALRYGVGGGRRSLLPTARNFASRCTGPPRFRVAKIRGNSSLRLLSLLHQPSRSDHDGAFQNNGSGSNIGKLLPYALAN